MSSPYQYCSHNIPYTKICVECKIVYQKDMLNLARISFDECQIKLFKLELRKQNEIQN